MSNTHDVAPWTQSLDRLEQLANLGFVVSETELQSSVRRVLNMPGNFEVLITFVALEPI